MANETVQMDGEPVPVGLSLNEVISSRWGFTWKELGLGDSEEPMTHADVLCALSPNNAPYVYDDMVDCVAAREGETLPARCTQGPNPEWSPGDDNGGGED